MTRISRAALRGGAASLAITLGLASAPALAQATATTEAATDTIIVTGTRIARPNLEQSSPVAVVDGSEIVFQQPVSAEDFLRTLPITTPSIGPQTNNGSNGSARLNLRGLGSNRNLVLLNSRRITPRDTDGVVDLNTIPVALIERTELLTGGASTQYGADAVAGVVNFITRRDFSGVEINGLAGLTQRGDGQSYRVDATIGANFDDGRGNAVLSFGYTETRPVLQGSREIGTFSRQSTRCSPGQIANLGCNPAINNTTVGFRQGSPTAAPASIGSPFQGRVNQAGDQFIVGEQNDYNFNPLNLFQSPLERFNIFGQARYEVSPAIELYSEAMYVKSIVEINLAPAGVFGSTINTPLNSRFLSGQQSQLLCQTGIDLRQPEQGDGLPIRPTVEQCNQLIPGGSIQLVFEDEDRNVITRDFSQRSVPVGVLRRFTEAGPRVNTFTTNMFNITGGARGPLTDTLSWDVFFTHGESDRKDERTGWGLLSRVRAGVEDCPPGSAPGCVPFNLFGPEGSITQAMLNYIDVPTYSFGNTKFTQAQALVAGDLGYNLPWATQPIGFASGFEHRRYFASSGGDGVSQIPGEVLGAGAAALPIRGSYFSNELFVELNVPVVADRPFFHDLTIEAGARYADYSTSGGNWTYKGGGSWSPIRDFKVRGAYTRAVRAPNIGELFQPQVTALTARPNDPCQGTLAEINARGANFEQLCRAQLTLVGAPQSLLGTIPPPAAGQIQSTQGGNPDLDPEIAVTTTIGGVFQPSFFSGFNFTVDYFKIRVTDAISTPSQGDVIDGCFQANPIQSLCNVIFRNPLTGGLSGPAETTFGPVLTLSNLGTIQTDGIDFVANFTRDFGAFTLNANFNGTWTRNFLFQATPLSINRQCIGYYSVNCGVPQPEFLSIMRTTFSFRTGTDLSFFWRYLKGVEVEPLAPVPQLPVGTPTTAGPSNIVDAYQSIPAYNYLDLAIQQQIMDNVRLTFTVTNLTDKDPPDVGNT
ncbi:MAG: TonB-dependent receptor, partial [Sphingomonadaceae bacterium]